MLIKHVAFYGNHKMERQNKMDGIDWVLRIVETLKKILNPITWAVYFPSTSERVLLLSLHCILDLIGLFSLALSVSEEILNSHPPAHVTE